jgi:hypothetical protein
MLRGAPPAAGPTGTVGRARATPELHGAVRTYYEAAPSAVGPTGTTGSGRAAEASRRRMRISAPPAARPLLGSRAVRGLEELLDPERETTRRRMHASAPPAARPFLGIVGIAGRTRAGGAARLGVDLHVYACPPWHRRPRDPQGNRGLWAGRRSCVTRIGDHRSHGLSRDEVTVCLSISCTGGHGNDHVAIIIFYLTTFSEDSQRSSRNSLQALHESRGCIPCTRFNTV